MTDKKWQFWIDRGGTFTDIVACDPAGNFSAHKYLSENPDQYKDAAIHGMRQILSLKPKDPFPAEQVEAIKMGTTVATNALLEHAGEPTLLITNKGLGEALKIGLQHREEIFALKPSRAEQLFQDVIEVSCRSDHNGTEITALDERDLERNLLNAVNAGYRSVAVVLMHSVKSSFSEKTIGAICAKAGFKQISLSHECAAVHRYVSRGETTVLDAYLSPILRKYVQQVKSAVGETPLYFMQSHGGLTSAEYFRGRDAVLSGPAGGIVGASILAEKAGAPEIIAFDMGGTSTDVSHYAGKLERSQTSVIAGTRIAVPMMDIHTVAAGGGSICRFENERLTVGPASAGAHPGPACYGKKGPLTVTDCNLVLGKLQPDLFPKIFGPKGDQPLNKAAAEKRLAEIQEAYNQDTGEKITLSALAEGFVNIANEHMARAIRKVSVERGHNIKDHALLTYGGAGGQHACGVADALGISRVIVPPFSGVLSALGMGLADLRVIKSQSVEKVMTRKMNVEQLIKNLSRDAGVHLLDQGIGFKDIQIIIRFHVKYEGADTSLPIEVSTLREVRAKFESEHTRIFGFAEPDRKLTLETLEVEACGGGNKNALNAKPLIESGDYITRPIFIGNSSLTGHVLEKEKLAVNKPLSGPMIILEGNATTIVNPDWQVRRDEKDNLILRRSRRHHYESVSTKNVDPIMLEIFNNYFMTVAEEMGIVLAQTAHSVNVKERLDFSCAVFDDFGNLIANAPHMPVHLGSMGESVKSVIAGNDYIFKDDVFMVNDPYNGGTHLPDITVVTPVFVGTSTRPDFFVASRGHHADIGGISPGSMPAHSVHIDEEGILIDNVQLVKKGHFQEAAVRKLLASGKHPARKPDQNIADLMAQIAANQRGVTMVRKLVADFNLATVNSYMRFVRENAFTSVQNALMRLRSGRLVYPMDCGANIHLSIKINRGEKTAIFDFTGTSKQQKSNFNAPLSVTKAAILYAVRCLVKSDIPLNAGCLEPLTIIVPEGCFLNPKSPAAVVAGNVETSQAVTNALFLAMGIQAAAQGTMNNLTFGNEDYQYYETIAGGTGAGRTYDGSDAIQSHMTNSRLTDPEVLEMRYPVRLRTFKIRPDSGGKGAHKGGNGLIREIEFLSPMEVSLLSGHRDIAPPGLAGGSPGMVGQAAIRKQNGQSLPLKACDQTTVEQGDSFYIETPGGGGYGTA